MYRDLSLGLRSRISALATLGSGGDADCKGGQDAVKAHHRALQTVLDLEASLEKRKQPRSVGASGELDLDAARAEVLARLSVWLNEE